MVHAKKMTRKEKRKMYNKMPKKQIIDMLIACNDHLYILSRSTVAVPVEDAEPVDTAIEGLADKCESPKIKNTQDTFFIETSIGMIEIPYADVGHNIGEVYQKEWFQKLKELYDIRYIFSKQECPDFIFIRLDDPFYGDPEYKIIRK